MFVLLIGVGAPAYASTVVTGTIKGPHGELGVVNYTFSNGQTTINGSTNSSGVFTQTIPAGIWTFTATPSSNYTYADNINMPNLKVPDGLNINVGDIMFPNKAGAPDSDVAIPQLPSFCSAQGTAQLYRTFFTQEQYGAFLYTGRSVGVTAVTDGASNYTVTVDYSLIENQQQGTTVVTATNTGNGVYTASHTLSSTSQGGGPIVVTVNNGGSDNTTSCLMGMTNLDIRPFFTGSNTTDMSSVTDFRAITNFTMQQTGVAQVKFLKPVNMLDPLVQQFMQKIARKLVAKKGSFSLDAKAVLELKNSGAEVTLYNLPYKSTPTILLDGASAGSAAAIVSYDPTSGTLVFDAAHFSSYQAVPTVTTTAPTNNSSTSDTTTTVKGNVNDPAATVSITVNGVDQGSVTVDSSGNFSKVVSLSGGSNTISITAANSVGTSLPVTLTVTKSALPVTGGDASLLLGFGSLVVLGAGLQLARLKRSR